MPFAELPPNLQERVVCSINAAVKYQVPANIILAIAEKEGGRPGQWVLNTNGTHDVGPMQFNTNYLAQLAKFGITPDAVAASGCYPFELATWRLRKHIRDDIGDIWTRASNYHSRTPNFNVVYRADLIVRAGKWANWLEARYVTYDPLRADPAPQAVELKPVAPTTGQPASAWRTADYVPRTINGKQ